MSQFPIGSSFYVPAENILDFFEEEEGWNPLTQEMNIWENQQQGLVAVECVNKNPGFTLLDHANHWQVTKTRKAQRHAEPSIN